MSYPRRVRQPWSVQVELTEGCSRICTFCGLNGIRTGPGNYKFMSLLTAEKAAVGLSKLCPMARIEFAMHGEPLMHPQHAEVLSLFRARLPKTQIMVTTNGANMRKDMQKSLERLYSVGVDFVVLDTYYPERDILLENAKTLHDITIWDFYDDCVPKGWSPYQNHKRKYQRLLILMDDIGKRDGEVVSRTIMNHAGNMKDKPIPEAALVKTCTNPFRELSICYNGDVNVCCMDWSHEAVMGNVMKQQLEAIWYGDKFEAFRTALQNKDRRMSPCIRCDKNSGTRAGLLPKYPAITIKEIDIIRNTLYENPKPANGFTPRCEVEPGTRK